MTFIRIFPEKTFLRTFLDQAQVGRRLDNTIHWIKEWISVNNAICWIVIHEVDSVVHILKNLGPGV